MEQTVNTPIYNSLGVQYSAEFCQLALNNLFNSGNKAQRQLNKVLAQVFEGSVLFTYKGRDAIELAIRLIKTDQKPIVFTQAFTCCALEEAIVRAGGEVQYVDIGRRGTNLTVKNLEEAYQKTGAVSAVIVQHSLGIVADMSVIRRWCDMHQCVLIEDIAQSFGARDEKEKLVGTWGDITICSFGRDKIIDAVAGGACIVRKQTVVTNQSLMEKNWPKISRIQVITDMLYPQTTRLIRKFLPGITGKILFRLAKVLGILRSPISAPYIDIHTLSESHAILALWQIQHLESQLTHRTECAQWYINALEKVKNTNISVVSNSSIPGCQLRFIVAIPDAQQIAKSLATDNIFITDRWYRTAVDCGSYYISKYQPQECPQAELLADEVLNLPTHPSIQLSDVERLISALDMAIKKTRNAENNNI